MAARGREISVANPAAARDAVFVKRRASKETTSATLPAEQETRTAIFLGRVRRAAKCYQM
jgi:hypothetical protein